MRATEIESRFMMMVKGLGCQICLMQSNGERYVPAEFHHVRRSGEKKKHWRGIPLCSEHHRTGGYGIALEAGKKTWEAVHGSQEDIMEAAYSRLEIQYRNEWYNFLIEASISLLLFQPCYDEFWLDLKKEGVSDEQLHAAIKAKFAREHFYSRDWRIEYNPDGGHRITVVKCPGHEGPDYLVASHPHLYGAYARHHWGIGPSRQGELFQRW